MIHDFRTSEVLVPMVLVYLYLDLIYVNVNSITFCLSRTRSRDPHITPSQVQHSSLSSSAIMHGGGTLGAIQRLTIRTLPEKHAQYAQLTINLVPAPIDEGDLALGQL